MAVHPEPLTSDSVVRVALTVLMAVDACSAGVADGAAWAVDLVRAAVEVEGAGLLVGLRVLLLSGAFFAGRLSC